MKLVAHIAIMCKVVYKIKLIFSPAPPHILPKDLQHLLDFQLNFPTGYPM